MNVVVRKALYQCVRVLSKSVGLYPFPRSYGMHLLDTLGKLRIDCILDVGAHYGEWALFVRDIGFKGTIFSFEPVSASFRKLEERAAKDVLWHAFPYALGAEDTRASIHLFGGSYMNSLFGAQCKC